MTHKITRTLNKIPSKYIIPYILRNNGKMTITTKEILDRWDLLCGTPHLKCNRVFCMQCGKTTCQDCPGCDYNVTDDKCKKCFKDLANHDDIGSK